MKRTRDEIELTNTDDKWNELIYMNKRIKSNSYISGTSIKNYLLKDPFLDWLDLYYDKINKKVKNIKRNNKFKKKVVRKNKNLNILFDKGNEFESKIYDNIIENFKADEVIIINKTNKHIHSKKLFNDTKRAIKQGIPIILQAVLYNENNKTNGISDILIRSDYINKLVKRKVLEPEEEIFSASKLNGKYHYRVIDIKWSHMMLCSNGKNIRNIDRYPCYKGQLAIYNTCLGLIQGYIPDQAYIMSKSYTIDKKDNMMRGNNCFDLLGEVDYAGFDKIYIQKTIDAIYWLDKVRENGETWDLMEPVCEEMYPNMSNRHDAPWTKIKLEVSKNIDEITLIWNVSETNRKHAHKQGVMKWSDINCNSETLGIKSKKKAKTVDMILDINRNLDNKILPNSIKNNINNWKSKTNYDFYIDFETINRALSDKDIDIIDSSYGLDWIFMIGLYHNGEYKSFIMKELTEEEQFRIIQEFIDYINQAMENNKIRKPKLFYWSHAEHTHFLKQNEKYNHIWDSFINKCIWIDIYNIFTTEPIVIKGAFSFKLKEIGNAMYNWGMIESRWNGDVSDGSHAMFDALRYYKSEDIHIMKSIEKYNHMDCQILYDILEYLRS